MDNLITESNARLKELIENLATIKSEYEKKLAANGENIERELTKVRKYKEDFYKAREKVEKMNSDIEGFEQDYQNLVDRFKDDELANILIAANKEISAKIDERKRRIVKDRAEMNNLVSQAEIAKKQLVKLTAEKKALEMCLDKINDSHTFYSRTLNEIIDFSENNRDNLCAYFDDDTHKTEDNLKNPAEVNTPTPESTDQAKDFLDADFDLDKEFEFENVVNFDDSLDESQES